MFTPKNKKELQDAVNLWCDDKENAFKNYGDINDWDVSFITDMSSLFEGKEDFNDDISMWNVSNVKNMINMFCEATSFNQDIGLWNVSNVTNMNGMFFNAESFNQELSDWDVSRVRRMDSMFDHATSYCFIMRKKTGGIFDEVDLRKIIYLENN